MCFSSLVSEEEAGRGGEGRGEGWSWGGKGGTNRCASDTCCSCSPALQINSYRAGRCNERRWVNFVFVCLFVFPESLHIVPFFCTRARNVAVVHLVRTGTQFIQVFSILSISSSVSLTHGAAHTLTHTFASSDTHIESLHLMLFSGSSLAGYSGTIHRAGAERGRHLQAAAIHCNAMSVVKVSSWFF